MSHSVLVFVCVFVFVFVTLVDGQRATDGQKSEDRVNSSQIRNKNHQLIDDDDDALMGSLSAVRTS